MKHLNLKQKFLLLSPFSTSKDEWGLKGLTEIVLLGVNTCLVYIICIKFLSG